MLTDIKSSLRSVAWARSKKVFKRGIIVKNVKSHAADTGVGQAVFDAVILYFKQLQLFLGNTGI